jgi:hypothetical protein
MCTHTYIHTYKCVYTHTTLIHTFSTHNGTHTESYQTESSAHPKSTLFIHHRSPRSSPHTITFSNALVPCSCGKVVGGGGGVEEEMERRTNDTDKRGRRSGKRVCVCVCVCVCARAHVLLTVSTVQRLSLCVCERESVCVCVLDIATYGFRDQGLGFRGGKVTLDRFRV